ncbi:MAG: hypothetical protein ACK5LJ_16210 [Paracoccus sp. (in: a-proteobacteria)]
MAQRDRILADRMNTPVGFYQPEYGETDMGGTLLGYAPQFTVWAHLLPLRGSEEVMQARLKSKNPVILSRL